MKEFSYASISSLQVFKKLFGHKVEVTSFGQTMYLKWIKDKELPAFLRYAYSRMVGSLVSSSPASAQPQLGELANLTESRNLSRRRLTAAS